MTPIKPENRALYPKNWKQIRALVMARASVIYERIGLDTATARCECRGECGIEHWRTATEMPAPIRCQELHGYEANWSDRDGVEVVLTVAHLDHDPTNNDSRNLKAMCQRCHNRYDQPHRQRNAAKTRHGRKATGDLLAV